jgi:hypothetical protein
VQAGAGGGAITGAAAAGLVGSEVMSRRADAPGDRGVGNDVTGAAIPDTDQNAINSAEADAHPADPRGQWILGHMPGMPGANA